MRGNLQLGLSDIAVDATLREVLTVDRLQLLVDLRRENAFMTKISKSYMKPTQSSEEINEPQGPQSWLWILTRPERISSRRTLISAALYSTPTGDRNRENPKL